MAVIDIEHLSKDYGGGKGVFDISLQIEKGEVYGYLGPNGAGKSTTMRHLMGFSQPQSGKTSIFGLDCWKNHKEIQSRLGYLPGEISFPDDMTGANYLRLIGKMRGMQDSSRTEELAAFFEIDTDCGLKRMSKGMKQKIGIIAAFMHDPEILLLDEPTSGLDPLMQNRFVQLVEEERERGKTILLSSHIFEEVEKTCSRVGMIRRGRLVEEFTVDELRHSQFKTYKIEFDREADIEYILKAYPDAEFDQAKKQVSISINDSEINALIEDLAKCRLHFLKEEKHTLEDYFMRFYGGEENDECSLF